MNVGAQQNVEVPPAGPPRRVVLPTGESAWLLTRYEDVQAVLLNSSLIRGTQLSADPWEGSSRAGQPRTRRLDMNGPSHAALRRVLARTFSARRVEGMRSRIEAITNRLMDEIVEEGPPADLVQKVAMPVPLIVICELFGIPLAHGPQLRSWSNLALATSGADGEEVNEARDRMCNYFSRVMTLKRQRPGEDLFSDLIAACDQTREITPLEAIFLAVAIFRASQGTTVSAIGLGIWKLLRHPEQLSALCAGDAALLGSAIEELLRYEPLGDSELPRIATGPVQVQGVAIRPGDVVLLSIASANRDARYFTDADRFDIARHPNPHLTFGHGPHYCVGAGLARVELQTVLGTLVRRFPGLRLAVGPDQVHRTDDILVRGPKELPVTW